MPSPFTHAFAGIALGTILVPGQRRWIAAGALLAILPDADFIGYKLGVPYASMPGHRGLSHSIAAAVCLAGAVALWAWRRPGPRPAGPAADRGPPRTLFPYLLLAALSHGFLDALTNGGLGIAFFAPFSDARYFFPWRPIHVAPLSIKRFFANRGIVVIGSELIVVWLPLLAAAGAAWAARRRHRRPGGPGSKPWAGQ
jgi:inner membrane protein